jgi:hypothetical protein
LATQTGRSAIGTWPGGHGLPPERVFTQLLLTCENAWSGLQSAGPAAVVVLVLVVLVVGVLVVLVGVGAGAAPVVAGGGAVVVIVLVVLLPHAEIARASAAASIARTICPFIDFTTLPSLAPTGRPGS